MVETKWIIIGIILLLVLACAIILVLPIILPIILYSAGGYSSGTGSLETQSKNYWTASAPFAIKNFRASGNVLSFELQNVDLDKLTVTNISIDGVSAFSTSTDFEPGESNTITATLGSGCGAPGTPYALNNVIITYTKGTLIYKQIGTKPLVGKCS